MTILRHTGGNIGGVNPAQYAFWEDIESFVVDPATLEGTLVLKSGKSWNYLYATDDSIQIEGKEEETPAGMKYSYQVRMQVPKDRPEVEIILMGLNNRPVILSTIDKNGVSRYFGTLESPMKKNARLVKPAGVEEYHGWEIVFSGEFTAPAAYCSGEEKELFPPPEEE